LIRVASGDAGGKLRIWSWDNPEHLTKLDHPAFAGGIKDIDWDFESKKVVLVGEGSGLLSKVITWDTGNTVGNMPGPTKKVLSVAYKPTRPFKIMSCAEDYKVYCYSGPPFQMTHSKTPFNNFANCIRYSSDGLHVVCVGSTKIQLFAGDTGEEGLSIEKAHEGTIYSVSWCPDSQRFATASADKTVKIWSLGLDCLVTHTFPGMIGEMQVAVVWTKTNLVSLSLNGNINVLDTEAPGFLSPPVQDHQVK
jgi:WD repeat-containing protein 1 (actin-interacting protein 1)